MATPAMHRRKQPQKNQPTDKTVKTFTLSDGREVEYTLEGERRLLEKADEVLRQLSKRAEKRKK